MSTEHNRRVESQTIPMSRTEVLTGMRRKRVSYLEVNAPDRPLLNYKLSTKEVMIGRVKDNDITLPFSNVSRHHAIVKMDGEDCTVQDNNSTNGVYVNGVKVARCVLRSNDLIQLGETKIYYVEREELCR